MTNEQIILFALFAVVLGLFAWGRFRYDGVAFGALMTGVLAGVVPVDAAFEGFGHPATLIVALVLVASAGLTQSGAVSLLTRRLVRDDRPVSLHIAVIGGLGAALSGFMNNIAALALLMPVDMQTARKAGRAAALTLMPLAFATILGGMLTLIGTPPNILVSTIRADQLGQGFGMFDFAPVGLTVALAGLIFVALIGWRLIPVREGQANEKSAEIAEYVAEVTVAEGSPIIGKTIAELDEAAEKADIAILALIRDGKRRPGRSRLIPLSAGDVLLIEASPEALEEFRAENKLRFPEAARGKGAIPTGEGLVLIEAVVQDTSRIAGRTAGKIGLGWRHQTVLMGISRRGRTIRDHVRRTVVQPGDILLLLAPEESAEVVIDWLGCLPLARSTQVVRDDKAVLALGLFAGAVAAATFGIVSLQVALGLVILGYVAAKILPLADLYANVDWPVVVLLGSMIPLGLALDRTGGTTLIAGWLMAATDGLPAWVALLVLMVVTMTLSDVLNNNATTLVAAPVGIRLAEGLGVSPDPFLMAVAVAASCAFLTPIGHQNNTVVMGPGGYRFGDYWRMGLPLEIIVIAVGLPAILFFWPL
ncbi:MAG: SLC13 family permease [Gemmobacter sp.]